MNYISNFLAMRNAAGASIPMPSASKSPHPIDCDVDETQLDKFNANTGKSFTIASILGLKKKSTATVATEHPPDGSRSKELNAINLSIHNAQNFPPVPTKAPFNVVDSDQRFMPNRIPLAFAHHHMQASAVHGQHHSSAPHFYGGVNGANNNNNNNMMTMNHNGTSALQSLQQQFHAKNSQPFAPFHGKEQRTNKHGEFE